MRVSEREGIHTRTRDGVGVCARRADRERREVECATKKGRNRRIRQNVNIGKVRSVENTENFSFLCGFLWKICTNLGKAKVGRHLAQI